MDVGQLTTEQQIGLRANIPMINARKRLEAGGGFRDHDDAWDTVYLAFGSVELANKSRQQYLEKLVDSSCAAASKQSAK